MNRSGTCLLLGLLLASGCKNDVCSSGAVNPEGVGQSCKTSMDCTGTLAVSCPVETDPAGYAFCTRACYGIKPDECGQAAECRFFKLGAGYCIPTVCSQKFPNPDLQVIPVQYRCCVGAVNDRGVGKNCTSHDDCRGQAANSCGIAIDPGPTFVNFCSFLCSNDAECGPNAFCHTKLSPRDNAYVSVCTPIACKLENHPAPCPDLGTPDGGSPPDGP